MRSPGPGLEKPSDEVFPGGSYDRPWTPSEPGEPLIVEYAGGGAWAALDGAGTVSVASTASPQPTSRLREPGLYELASHDRHGMHEVRLDLDGEVRIWSLAFTPGPAA